MTATTETLPDEIEADSEIQEKAVLWHMLKGEKDRIEQEMKEITEFMAARVNKRALWKDGDQTFAISVVRSHMKVVDFDLLQTLDPDLFGMVTKTKVELNSTAFDKAKELGLFSNGTPAGRCVTYKPKSPSLRFGTYAPETKEVASGLA